MSNQEAKAKAARLRKFARVMRERERERVKAGLCRHCGGPVPCWSAFGDVAPGVRKANGGREGMR